MSTPSVAHSGRPDHDLPGLHPPKRRRWGCSSDLLGFTAVVLCAAIPLSIALAALINQLGATR